MKISILILTFNLINMEHIALIHRTELNTLLKKGYVVVNNSNTVSNNDVESLLKNTSPIEYSSDYVFITFDLKKKKLKTEELEFKDVISIIPLDISAKNELEITINKAITFSEPCWSDIVEDYFQTLSYKDMRKGAVSCVEMLVKGTKIAEIEFLLPDNFIQEVSNYLLQKEQLNSDSTLWSYLLMYERYEPYPKEVLGYFFDTLHVYTNYVKKMSLLEMPKTRTQTLLQEMENMEIQLKFEDIIGRLELTPISESFVQKNIVNGIKQYIVMPLYFLFKDLLVNENIFNTQIQKRLGQIKKKYKKEYAIAAYLVGVRLGYSSIYEMYTRYMMAKLGR